MNSEPLCEETRAARIEVDNRGFLRITLKKDAQEIDLDEAKKHVAIAARLSGNKIMPTLIDGRNYVSITPEARMYLANNELSNRYKAAEALLVKTLASKLIVKAYVLFNAPKKPHRIFTNEEAAIEWLLEYR